MAPVMSGNINGQPMSISSMNSRGSELGGMLESGGGPVPTMMHHPNQYTLANMMPGGMGERDLILGPNIHMSHIPPHLLPHVPHPGMPMGVPPRNTPYIVLADNKIAEFNRKLNQRSEECDNIWWDNLITDFFEDDAILTITCNDDGPTKRYTVGRTLIPRYFRSIFDSGCTECSYVLRTARENFINNTFHVESEVAQMMMTFLRLIPPSFVLVEGRLVIEFCMDDFMRIRNWNFQIRTHREFILRANHFGINQEQVMRDMSNNITIGGIPKNTMNFFRMCNILEPMQELMSRQKAYSLSPKDCLKTTLFQKWQRMVAPPGQPPKSETTRQSSKRRKRKNSNVNSDSASNRGSKRKQSPVPSLPNLNQPGDVMIVGEPTLMGGELGEEDERSITRLENTQYDTVGGSGGPTQPGSNGGNVMLGALGHGRHHLHHGPGSHLMMNPIGGATGPHFPMAPDNALSFPGPMKPLSEPAHSPAPPRKSTPEYTASAAAVTTSTSSSSHSLLSTSAVNNSNGGCVSNVGGTFIKTEMRSNNNCASQYPGPSSTPGTTKTSTPSVDATLNSVSDEQSLRSSKTGPPRPTSQGNQSHERSGDLIGEHQRPISEPLPSISGPILQQ